MLKCPEITQRKVGLYPDNSQQIRPFQFQYVPLPGRYLLVTRNNQTENISHTIIVCEARKLRE
jgi:hypothetical protein